MHAMDGWSGFWMAPMMLWWVVVLALVVYAVGRLAK